MVVERTPTFLSFLSVNLCYESLEALYLLVIHNYFLNSLSIIIVLAISPSRWNCLPLGSWYKAVRLASILFMGDFMFTIRLISSLYPSYYCSTDVVRKPFITTNRKPR